MTRFTITPGRSELTAVANSSVHPIHGEGKPLSGWVEAVVNDGAVDVSRPASAHLELEVTSLRADNPLVNREIQRRLDPRRYPTVRADIDELSELGNGRYGVRGKLSLHGITQEVSGEAAIVVGPDGVMKVDGELTLDIREYGLEPPKVLGLRVYPEVDVRLKVVATPD